ncbi:MAG: polysaccharide biosynthesis protein [Ruminococcaceae bacterium]|nr:polysaccharide biosynthesis protein [Oscillospiraceae bacterium]
MMAWDAAMLSLSGFLALCLRFDIWKASELPQLYWNNFVTFLPWYILIALGVLSLFRMYNSLWQFVSMREAASAGIACFLIEAIHWILTIEVLGIQIPRSCYPITFMIFFLFTGVSRFSYRIMRAFLQPPGQKTRNIMVIGAGEAANMLIREITASRELADSRVVCIIDDDTTKKNRYMCGVRIVGTRHAIEQAAKQYDVDEIIFAVPSASSADRTAILNICKNTGCQLKTLPGVYQIVQGKISMSDVRKVDIEDLLGRDPVDINVESVMSYVRDKVILVTGGGGSIGSELCRQIASHKPRQLVIFDIYENNAYDIQNELRHDYPELNLVTLIGSVRDTRRIDSVMAQYHPEIVYHAAAHKHVPLMEDSPNEAIKNNVFGTLKTAQAADRHGVKRFVLISTDKAVNPTNVMGATKRLCEMIVQAYNNRSNTEFVAVRFGNVLGSNGSVIPLFKKQIENGGPVLVTHPDIIRYFMTIPEAVSLVLQAGALANGGEIFVLDMGKPVKILDLANNLIRLSGYTPGEDIKIQFTGLRKGEKLYEELLMDEEGLRATENRLIHIGCPIRFDEEPFFAKLEHLREVMAEDSTDVRPLIQELVPTYKVTGDSAAQTPPAEESGEKLPPLPTHTPTKLDVLG